MIKPARRVMGPRALDGEAEFRRVLLQARRRRTRLREAVGAFSVRASPPLAC